MVNEPLTGKRYVKVTDQKTKYDWAISVREIADNLYADAELITLVMDNLGSHTVAALYETFESVEAKRKWDRFEFIYIPKLGSWLNMAEIELFVMNKQFLSSRIENKKTIQREVKAWQKHMNNKAVKIN